MDYHVAMLLQGKQLMPLLLGSWRLFWPWAWSWCPAVARPRSKNVISHRLASLISASILSKPYVSYKTTGCHRTVSYPTSSKACALAIDLLASGTKTILQPCRLGEMLHTSYGSCKAHPLVANLHREDAYGIPDDCHATSSSQVPAASLTADGTVHVQLTKPYNVRVLPYDCITKRLLREILVSRNLRHPHILRQHAVVDDGRALCVVEEHARSGNMLDYVLKNKKLHEAEARYARRLPSSHPPSHRLPSPYQLPIKFARTLPTPATNKESVGMSVVKLVPVRY